MKRAFTLIELMVVVAIVVILAVIAVPAIKSITKGNAEAQSVNMIRSALAGARGIAISQHRQAGVVFFEETPANVQPANTGQTAMQVVIEDYNQSKYGGAANMVFVYFTKQRQYLPAGIRVASLGDDPAVAVKSGIEATPSARAIMFGPDGSLVMDGALASPNPGGPQTDGAYPKAYADWRFVLPGTTAAASVRAASSSPGFLVFNMNDFKEQNFGTNGAAAATWITQHSETIIVNSITGGLIR